MSDFYYNIIMIIILYCTCHTEWGFVEHVTATMELIMVLTTELLNHGFIDDEAR